MCRGVREGCEKMPVGCRVQADIMVPNGQHDKHQPTESWGWHIFHIRNTPQYSIHDCHSVHQPFDHLYWSFFSSQLLSHSHPTSNLGATSNLPHLGPLQSTLDPGPVASFRSAKSNFWGQMSTWHWTCISLSKFYVKRIVYAPTEIYRILKIKCLIHDTFKSKIWSLCFHLAIRSGNWSCSVYFYHICCCIQWKQSKLFIILIKLYINIQCFRMLQMLFHKMLHRSF